MLSKAILNIQNKIVFQVVLILIIAALFAWRLPISYNNLENAENMVISAKEQMSNTEEKIRYIQDYRNLVNTTYKSYLEAQKNVQPICAVLANLQEKYSTLSKKFLLNRESVLTISPYPEVIEIQDSKYVGILANDIQLDFTAKGFKHAVNYIKSAYNQLPFGSVVESIRIEQDDYITPELVNQYGLNKAPQIAESKVKFKVREIRVRKSK